MYKVHIGVDMAKNKFDVYVWEGTTKKTKTFANTSKGRASFLKFVARFEHVHVVMEATGNYHLHLAVALEQASVLYSVVNPLQVKRFAQMKLIRIKTDASDARVIAGYAAEQKPPAHQMEPVVRQHLKQINTFAEKLIKIRTMLINQRHAFSFLPAPHRPCTKMLNQSIKHLGRQIMRLEQEQETLVDQAYKPVKDLALSVKGIGPRTVLVLIALLGDLSQFKSSKQVAAYMGLNPALVESGTHKPQVHISKQGHARLRTLFYLCALSAAKHNTECRKLYLRLLERGKKKKVALIAVANKLIRQVFAVIKSGVAFDDFYPEKISLNT